MKDSETQLQVINKASSTDQSHPQCERTRGLMLEDD